MSILIDRRKHDKKTTKSRHTQSHKNVMLSKRELTKVRKQLPPNGYALIADKVLKSTEAVKKVLQDPDRYNKDVIDAAFVVIDNYKKEVEQQKQKIKAL